MGEDHQSNNKNGNSIQSPVLLIPIATKPHACVCLMNLSQAMTSSHFHVRLFQLYNVIDRRKAVSLLIPAQAVSSGFKMQYDYYSPVEPTNQPKDRSYRHFKVFVFLEVFFALRRYYYHFLEGSCVCFLCQCLCGCKECK